MMEENVGGDFWQRLLCSRLSPDLTPLRATEPGADRRSSPRYRMDLPVRVCSDLLELDARATFEGEISDVSAGGLFVRSDFLEPPGTTVQLLVTLPDQRRPLSLLGRIAWVAEAPPKGPGMGIELEHVPGRVTPRHA